MTTWKIAGQSLTLDRTLIMGILNVTPDSFSDGGEIRNVNDAIRRVDQMVSDGADIIDVGGESSRPGSKPVTASEEIGRIVPAIREIATRFDVPISVDTYKSAVAAAAVEAGARIINDISAFRFDPAMARVVSEQKVGVILMHSRGGLESLHSTPPAQDIFEDVKQDFRRAIAMAMEAGITANSIALDAGIGFGKTLEQNLSLIRGTRPLRDEFADHAFVVGTSRKSFIGKVLGGEAVDQRLDGSIATAVIAAYNGVNIVRTHDIKETSAALKMVDAICRG